MIPGRAKESDVLGGKICDIGHGSRAERAADRDLDGQLHFQHIEINHGDQEH